MPASSTRHIEVLLALSTTADASTAAMVLAADAPTVSVQANASSAAATLTADAPTIVSGTVNVPSAVLTLAADQPSAAVTSGVQPASSAGLILTADGPVVVPPAVKVPSAVLALTADTPTVSVSSRPRAAAETLASEGPAGFGGGLFADPGVISEAAEAPTLVFTAKPDSAVLHLIAVPFTGGRLEIPVLDITRVGVAPAAQVASDHLNGMLVRDNDGRVFVEIISSDPRPQSVGFAIAETVDGQTVLNKIVSVPAGATRYAGPFPEEFYNQDDDTLLVNPSVDTTLKLRAYRAEEEIVLLDG
jgi:hypothetical protein